GLNDDFVDVGGVRLVDLANDAGCRSDDITLVALLELLGCFRPAQVLGHLGSVQPREQRQVVLSPGLQLDHSGMLPCQRGLRRRSLREAMRSARISSKRVRPGSITSSM